MLGYIDNFSDGIIDDLKQFKVVWNGDLIWITNYIKIIAYDREKMVFKVKNNLLIVEGVDIQIKMFNKNEIILKGKFNSANLKNPYTEEISK